MFKIIKNILGNISKGYGYVCDVQTIFNFMKKELEFSIENNLEAVTDFYIYYKESKHHVIIWNYKASTSKLEAEKGLSITLDNIEFNSIENFINTAKLENNLISELSGYLKIELTYSDSTFLNEYKKSHPNIESNY